MRKLTADFETTTDIDDCRVWAWAICEIGEVENFYTGNDIDSFMEFVQTEIHNGKYYFHNAKFDFQFIISWLLTHGFIHIEDKKDRDDLTFTTLITDTGQYYSMEVFFKVHGKKVIKATFYDSLKILNFSVSQIAKDFDLPIRKLELDYKSKRKIGHQLTDHEIDYIKNDVEIMARALEIMFARGLTKMTIGSDALHNYKQMNENFKQFFPVLDFDIDKDIRKSYKGGFTYLNPLYKGKESGKGIVFDKNSMYPAKMVQEYLPIGRPEYFEGQYKIDETYPLYSQTLTCVFKIKPGKIPSIQIKKSSYFLPNEYVENSDDQPVTLTLTTPDLELFLQQYDVWDLEWQGGWKFRQAKGLFDKYINYWTEQKIKSKKEGNSAMYTISKLLLNSLYGKMGLNPLCGRKTPYLDENGIVRYKTEDVEKRDPIYVAEAAFITAYARRDIIETSQTIRDYSLEKYGYDAYIYSDTDSIHTNLPEEDIDGLAKIMDIDDYRLGAWKLESRFKRGKYLRQKCYIEQDYNDVIHATVAGLPKKLSHLLNFDNFDIGFTTADFTPEQIGEAGNKLTYKYVKGGVVLIDTDFSII